MNTLKQRIQKYWDKRSASFGQDRRKDLESMTHCVWEKELDSYIGNARNLRILDIGTGSGFFAAIMARKGHRVTGIDLSSEMLKEARSLAQSLHLEIEFLQMDSEKLEWEDESFDIVMSRNVMWTLENPEGAYREWLRVLKKGGKLIVFDANHGQVEYAKIARSERGHSSLDVFDIAMLEECDNISALLPLSRLHRPAWDKEILEHFGVSELYIDTEAGSRLYEKEYAKTFCICAVK